MTNRFLTASNNQRKKTTQTDWFLHGQYTGRHPVVKPILTPFFLNNRCSFNVADERIDSSKLISRKNMGISKLELNKKKSWNLLLLTHEPFGSYNQQVRLDFYYREKSLF